MRNADVGIVFLHPVTHLLGMHGAAAGVNIRAVGAVAVDNDIGAELAQGAGRGLVGGTVTTIDDDGYTLERLAARKRAFSVFDIPAESVVDTHGLADGLGGGADVIDLAAEHEVFDLFLDGVGKLVAVVIEKLDAVVVVRIV